MHAVHNTHSGFGSRFSWPDSPPSIFCTTINTSRYKKLEVLAHGMYVCMIITYRKGKDQPGKVANPARGQLNRENNLFLCPRSRLRIWSRETGSVVPSRVSLLISIFRLNMIPCYLFSIALECREPLVYRKSSRPDLASQWFLRL